MSERTVFGWEIPDNPLGPLTRKQFFYDGLTGGQPVAPNQSAIAAIIAHRLVELEDEANAQCRRCGGPPGPHNCGRR